MTNTDEMLYVALTKLRGSEINAIPGAVDWLKENIDNHIDDLSSRLLAALGGDNGRLTKRSLIKHYVTSLSSAFNILEWLEEE